MTNPRPWPARLHALIYAAGALLMVHLALWHYLMGEHSRILLPALLAPLMVLAALLRLSHEDHARLSAYLVLGCGYMLVALEVAYRSPFSLLWLGLPPVLTLLLLPLWSSMLMNLLLAPLWLLLAEGQLDRTLALGYLTLIVVAAGLAPWEALRQLALLRATDPNDPECSAFNREALHDRLYSECERAALLEQRLAVVLIHLPQLEMAGEQFGHRARQALLDSLCQEVTGRCRSHDVLGRESQADFWLVLPDISENGALLVCQRLEEALRRTVLIDTGPVKYRMAVCQLPPDATPEHFEQRLQSRSFHLAQT